MREKRRENPIKQAEHIDKPKNNKKQTNNRQTKTKQRNPTPPCSVQEGH